MVIFSFIIINAKLIFEQSVGLHYLFKEKEDDNS
jgi:hypothetical protein